MIAAELGDDVSNRLGRTLTYPAGPSSVQSTRGLRLNFVYVRPHGDHLVSVKFGRG